MSAVAGVLWLDGRPARASDAARMTRAMASRGPDGAGVFCEGPVALAQALHRTLPDAGPAGPRVDRTGGLVLVADARLDNREDLITVLGAAAGLDLRARDEDLILAAYDRWGEGCAARLAGDFAFVLWDRRTRRLFGARDQLGVRPLIYQHRGDRVAFASEVRGLLALAGWSHPIDEARIADYLVPALEGVDRTSTFYRALRRLPPAHRFTVGTAGVSIARYWEPPVGGPADLRGRDAAEAFLAAFTGAVRRRLRSHRPAGSMLSGGIDSSSIVGVARRSAAAPLPTLSALADRAEDCPESRAIGLMLGLDGLEPFAVRPAELSRFRAVLRRAGETSEELFDAHMVLPRVLYAAARQRGLNVLLDGVDGDYVASVEPACLAAALRAGQWIAAARQAVSFSRYYRETYPPWGSPWRLLYRSCRSAALPAGTRRAWRTLRRGDRLRDALSDSIISPELAGAVDLPGRLEALRARAGWRPAPSPEEHQARELVHPYVAAALERYDRVASSFSVEARHPFFDLRVVEVCLALPWREKVRDGWPKAVVRRAMAGLVPDAVRWRPGRWERLGPAFGRSFLLLEREELDRVALASDPDLDRYVDRGALRRAHAAYREHGSPEDGERVWQAANLARWLERRRAGRPRSPLEAVGPAGG